MAGGEQVVKDELFEKLDSARQLLFDTPLLAEPEPWIVVANPGKRIIGISIDIFDAMMSELQGSRMTIGRLRTALDGLEKSR